MATDQIVVLLIKERDRIQRAIDALEAPEKRPGRTAKKPPVPDTGIHIPKKRHVSAAARRKMAAGQKRRWANVRNRTARP
jgi:hypothetical protein